MNAEDEMPSNPPRTFSPRLEKLIFHSQALLISSLFGYCKCFTRAYFCFNFNVFNLMVCQIVRSIDGALELYKYCIIVV